MDSKKKHYLLILANENPSDHVHWVDVCNKYEEIKYDIVDLSKKDALSFIKKDKYDLCLAKPPGLTEKYKKLYDEKVYIINNILKYPIYPSFIEILIYENKRFLSYWLEANNIPHPRTKVIYESQQAIEFIRDEKYPLVAKTNIGASGSGVSILKSERQAKKYIYNTFYGSGATKRWGPNIKRKNLIKRFISLMLNPSKMDDRMHAYSSRLKEKQKDYVIFQEYVPHKYEWRVVCIDDSYFAHKKLVVGGKASGSLLKDYSNPPLSLLDFARNIMETYGLMSQALDIFETENCGYLVNEMQCIFGQSDQYQMLIDGKPGRYRYIDGQWLFEEGMYNDNMNYELRIKHVIKILSEK